MTTTTTEIDTLVETYLDVTDRISELTTQQANLKNQMRDLGIGKHPTTFGVTVTVTPPSRSFNAARAWTMLTGEQQALCVSPDAKKIKSQLAPALTDACMDEGRGSPSVRVA